MILINQRHEILKPASGSGVLLLNAIEHAGRNCYASYDKVQPGSAQVFCRNLLKRGHETPLEFADMTVAITTSRAVLAELTRHRLASFCVESQRYIQEAKTGNITFIKPEWFVEQVDRDKDKYSIASESWEQFIKQTEDTYKQMIQTGLRPEEAREVLPNSTACRIVMKANVREWRHIFRLRCDKAAYPQMRSLMTAILTDAHRMIPVLFDDLYAEISTDIKGKGVASYGRL